MRLRLKNAADGVVRYACNPDELHNLAQLGYVFELDMEDAEAVAADAAAKATEEPLADAPVTTAVDGAEAPVKLPNIEGN